MEDLIKVLYIIPDSKYGDAERKLHHLLTYMYENTDVNIVVGFMYDNVLKNLLQSHGIYCEVFGGPAGLSSFIKSSAFDAIHFYGSRRILDILSKHAPHYTKIIELALDKNPRGDSTLIGPRSSIDLVLSDKERSDFSDANVLQFGVNPGLFGALDVHSFRRRYHIGRDKASQKIKTVGILIDSDEIDINFILGLSTQVKSLRLPLKIILFYNGKGKTALLSRIRQLQLGKTLYIESSPNITRGFVDVALELSDSNEMSVLEALAYKVPVVLPTTEWSKSLLETRKIGFLYDKKAPVDLLIRYCIAATKIDRGQITLPDSVHVKNTVEEIVKEYAPTERVAVAKRPLYCIIPYGIDGGAEIYLENHIKHGTRIFQNVHLIFMKTNPLRERLKNIVPCTTVANLQELGNFILAEKAKDVCFYNSATIFKLLLRVKKINPKIRITEIIHSTHKWMDSMHGATRSNIDRTISVSATVARQWSVKKFEVLPPRIDKARFQRVAKKPNNGVTVIGTVARLSPEKNLKRIIDILAYLPPDYRSVIVGADGGSKRELVEYASKKGVASRITIKPFTEQIELEYASFDVFLLTSHVEGTPITILEAKAAGIPIVAPDVGSIREMLRPEDFCFRSNLENKHIADKIEKLAGKSPKAPPARKKKSKKKGDKLNVLYVQKHTCIRAIKQGISLKAKGHNVHLICLKDAEDTYKIDQNPIFDTITKLPSERFMSHRLVPAIDSLISLQDIDVIHCHNEPDAPTLYAINNKYGIPVVHDTHDSVSMILEDRGASPIIMKKFKEVERRANEGSNGRIYVSQEQLNYTKRLYPKMSMENNLIVPNCFLDAWKTKIPRQKLSEKDGEIHIVYVGGVVMHDKSHPYYIYEVVQKIVKQGIHVHIYPSVSLPAVKQAFRRLGSYVHFHDSIAPEDIADEISQYDYGSCFFNELIPTSSVFEVGVPNKFFDYSLANIPTLTTDNLKRLSELIDKYDAGFVCSPSDLSFLKTMEKGKINYKEIYEEFAYENYSDRIIDLYYKIMRG